MAINRAEQQYFNKSLSEVKTFSASEDHCIFISHKSEDKDFAVAIGDYIMRHGKIDIYLDINDDRLQGAVKRKDHSDIVKYIELGLNKSTHLLCLISDITFYSWWVPYELGFAKKGAKGIASLKKKDIKDVPSFLKIEKVLGGIQSLNDYLHSIKSTSYSFSETKANLIKYYATRHPLENYLYWKS